MALLDTLKRFGSGARDVLLGQKASDVDLGPDAERAKQRRAELEAIQLAQLRGEQVPGQVSAARGSAREAISALEAANQSRVAGAGSGPGALLAQRQAAGSNVAGRAAIERGVTQTAQAAESGLIRDLRGAQVDAERARLLEEQERERARRKGLLPALTGIAGSLAGPQGGALGARAGEAVLRGIGR